MTTARSSSTAAESFASLAVDTLVQVVPGLLAAAVITAPGATDTGLPQHSWIAPRSDLDIAQISERAASHPPTAAANGSFGFRQGGTGYGVLFEPVVSAGRKVGLLIVARTGRGWARHERSMVRELALLLGRFSVATAVEQELLYQRRLDELVTEVAQHLMPVTAAARAGALDWTVQRLGQFLGADFVFLRQHDHDRGTSRLEATWPLRAERDRHSEIAFEADPVFALTRDLAEPIVPLAGDLPGSLLRLFDPESRSVAGAEAAVPLRTGEQTHGVLGVVFTSIDHAFAPSEMNALAAIAALVAQFDQRVEAESRIAHMAMHDELTGLANRRALVQVLAKALGQGQSVTVLLIDLDRFKVMNDFLGHSTGDRLLVAIADRVRSSVRPTDFAARLGSDEFVVVLGEAASELEALATADRLLDVIGEPVEIAGQEITHTASIGIARSGGTAVTALDLLGWADVALHGAKTAGRNRALVLDDVLRAAVDERSSTELSLRHAIENGGLRMHYQPEVDMRTGELLAFEALVRWEHATRGLLSAGEFIAVAEETGLVVELGRWVLTETCRQIAAWRSRYPRRDIVARINMSPIQFLTNGLVESVAACLVANNLPGDRICVEVTERAALDDPVQTIRILSEFRELGLTIALDDFGTGFASMADLKRLPVDVLKLDQAFVQNVSSDPADLAIVDAIIHLGTALELDLVAEGVETTAAVDMLLALGCTRGQGYLFSKALAPVEAEALLRRGRLDLHQLDPPGIEQLDPVLVQPLRRWSSR